MNFEKRNVVIVCRGRGQSVGGLGVEVSRDKVTCIDNSLILHIYIIVRKHYHTYFELIHAFYIWFWNNTE